MPSFLSSLRLGVVAAAALSAEAHPQTVTDIDAADATVASTPLGKNQVGDAVGIAFVVGWVDPQPVLFPAGAGAVVLPTLPGHEAGTAFDVSDGGVVAGESLDVEEIQPGFWEVTPNAVLWEDGSPATIESMLTTGTSYHLRQAVAINEAGQVAVQGRHPKSGGLHSFLFDEGELTHLGHLNPALQTTETFDMNEQRQIVGRSHSPAGFAEAFLWTDGTLTSLHDAAGIPGTVSAALAVNEAGVVVGEADFLPGFVQFTTAARWEGDVATDLGALEPGFASVALDVNDHGTIVGTSQTSSGDRAFLVEGDAPMEDLNARLQPGSGWLLLSATCITNDGRIFGEGVHAGENRPYVMEPACFGSFVPYAAPSIGAGGYAPRLSAQGCLDGVEDLSLVITNGVGGAPGLLLFGTGTGALTVLPGLELAVLPLTAISFPLTLAGQGDGAGTWQWSLIAPPAPPGLQLTTQALLLDASTPSGASATNALLLSFP